MILLFIYLYILFLFRQSRFVAVNFRDKPSIRANIRPPRLRPAPMLRQQVAQTHLYTKHVAFNLKELLLGEAELGIVRQFTWHKDYESPRVPRKTGFAGAAAVAEQRVEIAAVRVRHHVLRTDEPKQNK